MLIWCSKTDQKKGGKSKWITKKDQEGKSEAPTDDLSEPCNVEKLRERKKTWTYCKSSLRGPSSLSHSLFLCLSFSITFMPLSWQPRKTWNSERGLARDEGLRAEEGQKAGSGTVGQGRKNEVSEVFRRHICLTFLAISNKFSHSSWNRAPPFNGFLWQACALCSCSYAHQYGRQWEIVYTWDEFKNTIFLRLFKLLRLENKILNIYVRLAPKER